MSASPQMGFAVLLCAAAMAALCGLAEADGECGAGNGGAICPGGLCCSQYNWCGNTAAYCAAGCQSNCWKPPPAHVPSPPPTPYAAMKRIAYYPNWAVYTSPPYAFFPENISTGYFTHVLYAFAGISSTTFKVVSTDPEVDYGPDPTNSPQKGLYFRFNKKVHAGGAKTLISIGGGGNPQVTKAFSTLAKTYSGRSAFIYSAISFARKYGFDGIDLDWEIPTGSIDKANFATLLTLFRTRITSEAKATAKPALLLTAAVAAWGPDAKQAYDVPTLAAKLDWVGVMTYDFHGSWEKVTGLHTALADSVDPSVSIKGAVKTWMDLGLPKRKLVIGLAMYGPSWTLTNVNNHGVGAAATGVGKPGPITKDSSGSWTYYEIVKYHVNSGATVVTVPAAASVYAYKGTQWIGYDNVATIKVKAKYSKTSGFAGYMFWSIDQDDKFSLSAAAQAAIK